MLPKNLWDIWRGMGQNFLKFFKFWISEFYCFKKRQFFKSTNSEHFFTKISENGPWVSRRNCVLGKWCSSTFMVVRLSNKRAKTTKNAFLPLKWPFVGQPDNHIGWATSLAYSWVSSTYPRTISWNFGEKMFKIGGFEKLPFFEITKFQYWKFKKIWLFFFHSCWNVLQILWQHGSNSIFKITLISSKKLGGIDLWPTLYKMKVT